MAADQQLKGVPQLNTKFFNKWKGCVTRSSRNTLPEDSWFNLENLQPIGDGNVQSVANYSALLVDYATDPIYWSQYVNILGVDYLISFSTTGKVFSYNIGTGVSNQIKTGFSGSGSRVAQWKNQQALFIDSTGYFSWDGTTFSAKITGTGVPNSGTDIAVCFGRVWIIQGRLLTFSGADDFSATSFLVANGAGSQALTDPSVRDKVVRLYASNGYLYLAAASAILAISDVYVPQGASPPTPLYSNLPIQSIIGSDQPGSFFAMNRALMFANRYGAWAMSGVQAQKISTDIDGTWKYVDFSQIISGGQVVSNNILCSAFLIKRINDPVFGSNTVLAMYNDEKWWFANYGSLTFVVPCIANNQPSLFGFIGNKLRQLFFDYTTSQPSNAMTPLWSMDDPLSDKQSIRAGFEAIVQQYSGTFNMNIDTVNSSSIAIPNVQLGTIQWINNAGSTVKWANNGGLFVTWFTGSYLLYNGDPPGTYQKYIGATISSSGSLYQLSAVFIDYKLRARWTGG